MLNIEVAFVTDGVLQSLSHEIPIIRMNSMERQVQSGSCGSIVFQNVVVLLRPVDLTCGDAPPESSGTADLLPLSQEGFTALQVGVEAGVVQRHRGLRS